MKPYEYYAETRRLLVQKGVDSLEAENMIDYLRESAADSGQTEEQFLAALGSPEQTAADFVRQIDTAARKAGLPPLPETGSARQPDAEAKKQKEKPKLILEPEKDGMDQPEKAFSVLDELDAFQKEKAARLQEEEQFSGREEAFAPFDEDHIPENYRKDEDSNPFWKEDEADWQSGWSGKSAPEFEKPEENPFVTPPVKKNIEFRNLESVSFDLMNGKVKVCTGPHPGLRVLEGEGSLEISQHNGRLKIGLNDISTLIPWKRKAVVLELTLPDRPLRKLSSSGLNTRISITGLDVQKISLDLTNGEARVENCTCEKISSDGVNGRIEVKQTQYDKGSFSQVNGRLDIEIPAGLKIHAEKAIGPIQTDAILAPYVQSSIIGSSLNVKPKHVRGKVSLSSVSGEMRLSMLR